MNFMTRVFRSPEKNLKYLVDYFDYFSTICADKKLTEKLLSKIKKCAYSGVPEKQLEIALSYISTNRLMFREPQLLQFFHQELNNHFTLNCDKADVKIIFDKIDFFINHDFDNQRKNIKKPNQFNTIDFGVIIRDIYEINYQPLVINNERDYLNNTIIISSTVSPSFNKKQRI